MRLLHLIALTHWPWREHVGLGALTLTVNHPTLMWFPGQAAFQFRPYITYSDTNRGRRKQRYSSSDEGTISTQTSTSSCCLMTQTTNINAHMHINPFMPPGPAAELQPLRSCSRLLRLNLCAPIGPLHPRGQMHCQSGWCVVFHSANQHTELWWVSTLVVKVTFDGWEGYGSECWGDFVQASHSDGKHQPYTEDRDGFYSF